MAESNDIGKGVYAERMHRDDLERAYRNTTYLVDHPEGKFGIRLGEPCPRLDAELAAHGATKWAFVSAWNPRSQPQSAVVNAERHADLLAHVAQLGCPVFAGRGQPDSSNWVAEDSLLILDIAEAAALALGAQFGQHAIVVGEAGGCADLRWC